MESNGDDYTDNITPNAIVRGSDEKIPNNYGNSPTKQYNDSSVRVSQPPTSGLISPNHETDADQNTLLMSKYTNRNNPKAKLSDRKDWNQQTSIRSEDTNCRAGKNPTWLSSPGRHPYFNNEPQT